MNQPKSVFEGALPGERLRYNEPMARHTTIKVGGPADVFFEPASEDEVLRALQLAKASGIPALVLGNGSNVIIRDAGIRGLVVALGEGFSCLTQDGLCLTAQAGARLSQVGAFAQKVSLTGFEFAAGIPGSVGGGVAMNAGAYGGELKDVLSSARVLVDETVQAYCLSDFAYGYRSSRVLREGGVVLSATFALKPGDSSQIACQIEALAARRRDKQPLSYPSAGSVFKRPEGHFAGALIEQAGLKGLQIGDAAVSTKHAGFIVNLGHATASDVLSLIEEIQTRVLAHSGVLLSCEVRILGEEG